MNPRARLAAVALLGVAPVAGFLATLQVSGVSAGNTAVVPVAFGGIALGVVLCYVAARRRAHDRVPSAAAVRQVPYRAAAEALPLREARAIAPAPQVTVNIGADLLAGLADLMAAAQRQPHPPVIVQAEQQELPR